jgi:5-methylcytosine-specific restriction endonuclease McrA
VSMRKRGKIARQRAVISADIRHELLARCLRRCCMCFVLNADLMEKEGQIAHLDRNRAHCDIDNLVYLCQECHTRYDKKSNRTLSFTPGEVRAYRDRLYQKLGHDCIEMGVTVRIHRDRYEAARQIIEQAKTALRRIGLDVTVREGPAESK